MTGRGIACGKTAKQHRACQINENYKAKRGWPDPQLAILSTQYQRSACGKASKQHGACQIHRLPFSPTKRASAARPKAARGVSNPGVSTFTKKSVCGIVQGATRRVKSWVAVFPGQEALAASWFAAAGLVKSSVVMFPQKSTFDKVVRSSRACQILGGHVR